MNSKRMFYLMCACLGVLIIAIVGCTYVANGLLEKRAGVLSDLKVKNEVLAQEQQGLVKTKKDISRYSDLEKIARAIVPQDKDQAETVREIIKLAAESGITPTSITFPNSTLGAASPGTTAAGTPAATPSGAASKLTQLTAVLNIPGVYVMPITITQSSDNPVPYAKFLDFLSRLEQNRRTAQVSNIVLQPNVENRALLSYTLTVEKYIKP